MSVLNRLQEFEVIKCTYDQSTFTSAQLNTKQQKKKFNIFSYLTKQTTSIKNGKYLIKLKIKHLHERVITLQRYFILFVKS